MKAIFADAENCLKGTHNGLVYEVTEEAKCEKNAVESATCTLCGEVLTREVEESALGHDIVIDEAVAPKCSETGLTEGSHCSRCNDKTIPQDIIPATGDHADADGDGKCDNGGENIICPDCGRPVHAETGIPEYICVLMSLIKILVSFIKAVNPAA